MSVKCSECKVVEGFLIIRLSVPPVIIAISQIFLRLTISFFSRQLVVAYSILKALLEPPMTIMVNRDVSF